MIEVRVEGLTDFLRRIWIVRAEDDSAQRNSSNQARNTARRDESRVEVEAFDIRHKVVGRPVLRQRCPELCEPGGGERKISAPMRQNDLGGCEALAMSLED